MPPVESPPLAPGPSRDRALVYALLAGLFRPPDEAALLSLKERAPRVDEALGRLGAPAELREDLRRLAGLAQREDVAALRDAYFATFEPSGEALCPPNEVHYTAETPQHALTRTYELADVAGFYRAFGVEVAPGSERVDHAAVELEFLHLLAVKQGVAEAQANGEEHVQVCAEATRAFLRDHAGRWLPRLAERLAAHASHRFYALSGQVAARFVAHDAATLGAA